MQILLSTAYNWEIKFPEDGHLVKSESARKQYYYHYYQTATTYDDARRICRSTGDGWDVASFQAKPVWARNSYGAIVFAEFGM